jgi:DNA polymerase (family X)
MYPEEVLDRFDFVMANIHGRFKPDWMAHQGRPGYDIDVEKVLRACTRQGVAVEIKAHPRRLDLDWRWHQTALDFGGMMSIIPDAHSIRELDHMHWASRWPERKAFRPTVS